MKMTLKDILLWISTLFMMVASSSVYASEEAVIEEYFNSFSGSFMLSENKQFLVTMKRILTGDALSKEIEWYEIVSTSLSQRYEPRHFSLKNARIENMVLEGDKAKVTVTSIRADNDLEISPFMNNEITSKIKANEKRIEEVRLSGRPIGKGWYATFNTLEEYLFHFDNNRRIFKIENQIISCEFKESDPESFNR